MKPYLFLIVLISARFAIAQSTVEATKTVEVRLTLLQAVNAKGINELALGVSVINHTNNDIYIRKFRPFLYGCIHYYQQDSIGDLGWKEIDRNSHDYYRPNVDYMTRTVLKDGTIIVADNGPGIDLSTNEITDHYNGDMFHLRNSLTNLMIKAQDSLGKGYEYNNAMFLKAGQELQNYIVTDIDFLSRKPREYKIAFYSEHRDSADFRFAFISDKENLDQKHGFQETFNGFHFFWPKSIISNVVYYTSFPTGAQNAIPVQAKPTDSSYGQMDLGDFIDNTRAYMKTKIIEQKQRYINKDLDHLLDSIHIPVKSYIYMVSFDHVKRADGISVSFFPRLIVPKLNSPVKKPLIMVILWKDSTFSIDTAIAYARKDKGEWTKNTATLYGKKIIRDIMLVNYDRTPNPPQLADESKAAYLLRLLPKIKYDSATETKIKY